MIESDWLRWLITVLFAFAAVDSAYRVIRPERSILRYCHLWHLLMALAMLAMSWPWGHQLPALPQIVVFSVALLWFVWLGISGGCCASDDPHRNLTRLSMGYHALMMAAMAWMLLAMSNMGEMAQHSHHMISHGDHHMPQASASFLSAHHQWIGQAWIAVFTLGTLYYLLKSGIRLLRQRRIVLEEVTQATMALGMVLMTGAML
ncbi:DUF5134 domain-containing protein [Carnimonas nigrificans]|uniref:DUF5134 domain-containing protein n=1 Tax=Carnimonas nigrificans TaxID=64323 RepID=UPI00046F7898|nr:DUF5134 domain-containing protein [Carnimonas nigrificans]